MEVVRISTECIKPSRPTPEHLKTHKLSLLDQFVPYLYVTIVLYYANDQSTQAVADSDITPQRLKLLKQSLSETLTRFYPFAGRIKSKLSIECSDEGVHYIEAKASSSLLEFFNQPNLPSFFHKLLPSNRTGEEATEEGAHVAMIQVTSFACGGMAIGVMVSHTIADGSAISFFLNSWSATSRQQFQSTFPEFDTPFPRNSACPKNATLAALLGQFLKKGRLGARRFLFDAKAISKLRAQGSSSTVPNPSRVEAVSSLISKCAMATFKANSGSDKATLVNHAVNMRRRANPAFPESCMGNFIWPASALMSAEEKVIELPNLVKKLREAITTINSDFVKNLQDERGFLSSCEDLKEMVETTTSAGLTSGAKSIFYTSWCNLGFYDVDFGWGKPTWVSCLDIPAAETLIYNTVYLMDTPLGDGIEAWVFWDEDDLALLQQDEELPTFAIVDPNPLQPNSSGSHMHDGLPQPFTVV